MNKQELCDYIKKENTLDDIPGEDIIKYMPGKIRNRKEEWKDIDGYEGFQISDKGRVRYILDKPAFRRPYTTKNAIMDLMNNGYGYFMPKGVHEYIHRLVALEFIPNPHHFSQVNHKDEIKKHNWVENLEWCSAKHNSNWGMTRYRRNSAIKEAGYKISAGHKGKKFTEEHKRKLSASHKGKRSKPIVQLTMDGKIIRKWENITEIREALKCGDGPARCCKGSRSSFRNCKWQYWENYVKNYPEML